MFTRFPLPRRSFLRVNNGLSLLSDFLGAGWVLGLVVVVWMFGDCYYLNCVFVLFFVFFFSFISLELEIFLWIWFNIGFGCYRLIKLSLSNSINFSSSFIRFIIMQWVILWF